MEKETLAALDDRFIIRFAVPDDTDELASFHRRNQEDEAFERWVRGMMVNKYCSPEPDRFLVVEDTLEKRIASSLAIIPSITCYGGLPMKTARIDIVSTDPEYRNRGFVRSLFQTAKSYFVQNDIFVNCVIGRPWYYTQFGDYAVARPNEQGLIMSVAGRLDANHGKSAHYSIHDAEADDLDFCAELYRGAKDRYLLFRYMHNDQFASAANFPAGVKIIKNAQHENIGFLAVDPHGLDESNVPVYVFEVIRGISWLDIKPVVLNYMIDYGEKMAAERHESMRGLKLVLGEEHPFYHVMREYPTRSLSGFPGYIEINDLVGFFKTIGPVLEQRIEESVAAGFTGSFKINLWRKMQGIAFEFVNGFITKVESCSLDYGDFNIPQPSLTQLIFGWKSVDELLVDYPEVQFSNADAEVLARTLFPQQPSFIPF